MTNAKDPVQAVVSDPLINAHLKEDPAQVRQEPLFSFDLPQQDPLLNAPAPAAATAPTAAPVDTSNPVWDIPRQVPTAATAAASAEQAFASPLMQNFSTLDDLITFRQTYGTDLQKFDDDMLRAHVIREFTDRGIQFTSASGKITVPISRPSKTAPLAAKLRW